MPTIEPLCLPHGLNCYSQLKHDRRIHCDQHNALSSTDKSLEMQKIALNRWLRLRTLATMIKNVELQTIPTSPFSLLPSSLFWRAIACRLLFHVLPPWTAADQTVKSVAFLLPPTNRHQSRNTRGRALDEQRCIFLGKCQRYFSLQRLTKCWRCREEDGFDETPIGPPGSKRQLMGCWNDIIVIHDPLKI